jgi:hypothetical protein
MRVRAGAPLDEGHGVLAEVAHRFVHTSIGWIVYGKAVHGFETLDVVRNVDDRDPQQLFGRTVALGSPPLLVGVGPL